MSLFNTIAYGADYNPEQWPEHVVDEDTQLMQQAGVNLISVGIFAWSKIEPREGEFHFDWLDKVLDKLHAAGVHVSLATATASPPPWIGHNYPETLPVDADGRRLTYGSRQQYNPSSAKYRSLVATLVRKIAERYANHPALTIWHVNNEYGCHTWESFDDESAAAFRVWLEARYGSLAELNRVWGTDFWSQHFSEWAEIIPPRATPTFQNPAHLLDWRRFSNDALLELYLTEVRILREVTPDVPLTTNFMGLFKPLNYWAWAEHIDIISNDSYPDPSDPRSAASFALDSDLMRSLGGGAPFLQLEQTVGQVQWRARNAVKRPGQFRMWSLQAVARGADSICQFQWRQSRAGSETFHAGMVPHSGTRSPLWRDVVGLGADLAKLAPVADQRVTAQVALLWDWESAWAREYATGPVDTDPAQSLRDWHGTCYENNVTADIVRPGADLADYDFIVVPSLFHTSPEAAAQLERAARRGATIVMDHFSGVVDDDGHAHLGGYLGPLTDLVGARVLEVSPLSVAPQEGGSQLAAGPGGSHDASADSAEVSPISSQVTAPSASSVVRLDSTVAAVTAGRDWTELLDVTTADVVARFADGDLAGEPALLRNAVEAGTVWYSATRLDATSRQGLLRQVAETGAVALRTDLPAGIELVRRGDVEFYLNHGDQPRTVPATGHDLLNDCTVDENVTIAPRSAAVVHLKA